MQARLLVVLGLAAGLWTGATSARAAADSDALRQKDAEVRELRRRLEQAEKELEQLRRDNERLRRQSQKAAPPAESAEAQRTADELRRLREENARLRQRAARAPAAAEVKPVRPLAGLPPVTPETVVEVDELVGHFLADPAAAAARYAKKTFRVRGEVERFHTALLRRQFTVLLRGPDGGPPVACRFNYIDRYKTVFTTQSGRVLTARYDSGRETTLLETGQGVVIAGRCGGLDANGTIEFSRCELVR
jgi:hypothetical protein